MKAAMQGAALAALIFSTGFGVWFYRQADPQTPLALIFVLPPGLLISAVLGACLGWIRGRRCGK